VEGKVEWKTTKEIKIMPPIYGIQLWEIVVGVVLIGFLAWLSLPFCWDDVKSKIKNRFTKV